MSDLVGNPEDRFSHNEDHLIFVQIIVFYSYRRCFSEPNIKYSLTCLHKIKCDLLGLYGHLEANKHGKYATDISFTCTSSVQSA